MNTNTTKTPITPSQCEQCQQQQSDSLWLVFTIGFIIGASAGFAAAWIFVGALKP